MKIKKLATAVIACTLLLGGQSAFAASNSDTVTIDGFTYSKNVVDGLNHLNAIRAKMGSAPVELDPYLTKAAVNHANYVDANGTSRRGVFEHDEVKGSPSFTGETSAERYKAVGGTDFSFVGEVIANGNSDVSHAVDTWTNIVYHRTPVLDPCVAYVGIGVSENDSVVLDTGYDNACTQTQEVSYPYDGQTNVPLSFVGNLEAPNPLTQFGVSVTGFPISFQTKKGVLFEDDVTASIKGANGKDVPFYKLSDGAIFLLPKSKLAANTTYTISVSYKISYGKNEGQTGHATWSFTTQSTTGSTQPTSGSNDTNPDHANRPGPSSWIPADQSQTPSTTKYDSNNTGVKINGEMVAINPTARIIDGSTFIPLRGVFEKLNAEVKWNGEDQSIDITRGNTKVHLQINNKKATINGKAVTLDIAPFISKEGSTFVPLRFASEALGAKVGWDQQNYIALIDLK